MGRKTTIPTIVRNPRTTTAMTARVSRGRRQSVVPCVAVTVTVPARIQPATSDAKAHIAANNPINANRHRSRNGSAGQITLLGGEPSEAAPEQACYPLPSPPSASTRYGNKLSPSNSVVSASTDNLARSGIFSSRSFLGRRSL